MVPPPRNESSPALYSVPKASFPSLQETGCIENKYDLLGKHYAYKHQPSLHKEDLEEYKDTFIKNGIKAFF